MRSFFAGLLFATLALPLGAAEPANAVTLDPGLGSLHWPVSTSSPKAQAYFDQGMRYVYAFNHEAAIRSFNEATRLDPDLAIGYWGTALALGPNINLDVDPDREKQAYEVVHEAQKHLQHASEKERGLIDALANRYSNDPKADLKKLNLDYSNAMGALAKKYPDDSNVNTLYAESLMDLRPWKFWTNDGKPAEGTEEVVRVLEGVLGRDPNHLGANHYYIHAIEESPHPERALAAATRLPRLAPAAGHLVHMPAHVLERTGHYASAAAANEAAARTDRAYIARNGEGGVYPMMYYNHNLQFGAAAYAMDGNFAAARRMAGEVSKNAAAMLKDMPPIELALAYPAQILVRFGRWQDVVKAGPPDEQWPISATVIHLARGTAFARLGNVAGAESERKALQAARAKLTDDPGLMQNSPKPLGEMSSLVLGARIAAARGEVDEAVNQLTKAVTIEDSLNYDEPPDWWLPVRETLGATLLRAGRSAQAEKVFREDLARNPKNPRSLYGLALALKAQKKDGATAMSHYRQGWKGGALTLDQF
jgi:tetratricopeptide (TPR) repeat protein